MVALQPLPAAAAAAAGLPAGDWRAAELPVWATAAVLDIVFSDEAGVRWDNNGGRDFHSGVRDPPTGECARGLFSEGRSAGGC